MDYMRVVCTLCFEYTCRCLLSCKGCAYHPQKSASNARLVSELSCNYAITVILCHVTISDVVYFLLLQRCQWCRFMPTPFFNTWQIEDGSRLLSSGGITALERMDSLLAPRDKVTGQSFTYL